MKKYLWLLLFFALAYLPAMIGRPMVAVDEFRYAEIAREMRVSGDWVTPRLAGVRYFEKPIFGYWAIAGAQTCFGDNAFAARFPGAAAALLTAFLLVFSASRLGASEDCAHLAGAAYLACGMVFGVATTAVLDSLLSGFTAGTLFFFLLALEGRSRSWLWLLLCGASMGFAFLTKGFLAFAVPGLTVAAYLLWLRRWKAFVTLPWLPLIACIGVVLPWAWLIHRAEPDFWRYFFWEEHVQRFFGDKAWQHPQPFWILFPVLIGGAFPAMLFAVDALWRKRVWKELLPLPMVRFSLCGVVLPLLFFSLSRGKLATYVMPCFAPLALLIALLAGQTMQRGNAPVWHWVRRSLFWLLGIASCIALVAAVGVAVAGRFGSFGLASQRWFVGFPLFLGVCAVCGGVMTWGVAGEEKGRIARSFDRFLIAVAVAMGAVSAVLPDFGSGKMPRSDLQKVREMTGMEPSQCRIVTVPALIHATSWCYRRDDVKSISVGELEYGHLAAEKEGKTGAVLPLPELIREFRTSPEGVIFIHRSPQDRALFDAGIPGLTRKISGDVIFDYRLPLKQSPQK